MTQGILPCPPSANLTISCFLVQDINHSDLLQSICLRPFQFLSSRNASPWPQGGASTLTHINMSVNLLGLKFYSGNESRHCKESLKIVYFLILFEWQAVVFFVFFVILIKANKATNEPTASIFYNFHFTLFVKGQSTNPCCHLMHCART